MVFVTAYDNHAVDAFEVAAVDYLLKPIRAERLALALTRVRAALDSRRAGARLAGLRRNRCRRPRRRDHRPGRRQTRRSRVELGGVTRYIRRSDIVYVEAQRDYVRLCTRSGGHLVRVPLANLEERWEPAGFLRVHRRFLVNSAFVEALRTAAGRVSVDLGAGQSVPVSRRFTPEVRAALVQRHRLRPGRHLGEDLATMTDGQRPRDARSSPAPSTTCADGPAARPSRTSTSRRAWA